MSKYIFFMNDFEIEVRKLFNFIRGCIESCDLCVKKSVLKIPVCVCVSDAEVIRDNFIAESDWPIRK